MNRTWLVLLVLAGVVLAGCSAPGGSPPSDGSGDVSYPSGWGPDGPDNATRAIHGADEAVAGQSFLERRVSVERAPEGMEAAYIVDVLVVRVDRERERLLAERRFYLVDAEVADAVADAGVEPLADRRADEVRVTYLHADGGNQYYRLGNRSPRITSLDSGDYGSAIDQPLPAVLVDAQPILVGATYANPTPAGSGVSYSLSNVSAFQLSGAAGPLTVRSDGLVSGFNVTEPENDSQQAFRYELEVGNVSIDEPEWSDDGGANRTPSQ